ncbi:SAM-dependent methyltransferase [Amycolatopsis pigmentata]|uniref:SAM-dependent methyltransferase n=1 Tax=Amycolatopsis pigmentata TaxID=450801 RepID=A0ABW5FYF1_9PSEU
MRNIPGYERFPAGEIDLDRPNLARIYDYYLGGTANYAVDRVFAEKALEQFPFVRPASQSNRLFLHRAVRHLIKRGIRQFVDIGSGVPTMGCTHQVADELTDDARVCYIDNEPVAVAHSRILLEDHGDLDRHTVVQADLRDTEALWDKVADTGIIDTTQPLALMMIAVLHVTQPDDTGADIGPQVVAEHRDMMPSGSYLVFSHGTADGVPEGRARQMAEFGAMYDKTATPVIWRPRAEIEEFFGDLELIEPGATWTPLWHPEERGPSSPDIEFDDPSDSVVWAGVAYKP